MMLATQIDRNTLDINGSARDGLIFDLQNTADMLANHNASDRPQWLATQAERLIEAGVWNKVELQRLLNRIHGVWELTAELNRSLLQRF